MFNTIENNLNYFKTLKMFNKMSIFNIYTYMLN